MTYKRNRNRQWLSKSIICLSALLLCLSGALAGLSCDGTGPTQPWPELPGDQAILFEVSYVNHAWGYRCSGWYINGEGERFSYEYEQDDDPWQPQNYEAITEQELLTKFSHGAKFLGSIDSAAVASAKNLIPASAVGGLSDTVWRCADFGAVSYTAYMRDHSSLTYHPVPLYEHGDWAFRNLSGEARWLFDWLRDVSGEQGEIPCAAPE